jgi:hypothetical protein
MVWNAGPACAGNSGRLAWNPQPLIQIADFLAYFLRRYAEIQEGLIPAKYPGEGKQVADWVKVAGERCIGSQYIYPAKGRCAAAEMFYENCPPSLRKLAT